MKRGDEDIAAGRTLSNEEVVAKLDTYLNHIETLMADVRGGDESAEREGWLTQEEVFERLHHRPAKLREDSVES